MESEGFNLLYDYTQDKRWAYQVRVIATTERMLREHPDWTTSLLKAMIRAFRLMKTDAISIVRKSGREWQAGDHPSSFDKSYALYSVIPMDGSASEEGVKHVADAEKGEGRLPADFDVESLLRLEHVRQAAKELNDRFGPQGFE